jgi:hypothetical protein
LAKARLKVLVVEQQLDKLPTRLIEAKNINKEEPILGSFKDLFNIFAFLCAQIRPHQHCAIRHQSFIRA